MVIGLRKFKTGLMNFEKWGFSTNEPDVELLDVKIYEIKGNFGKNLLNRNRNQNKLKVTLNNYF